MHMNMQHHRSNSNPHCHRHHHQGYHPPYKTTVVLPVSCQIKVSMHITPRQHKHRPILVQITTTTLVYPHPPPLQNHSHPLLHLGIILLIRRPNILTLLPLMPPIKYHHHYLHGPCNHSASRFPSIIYHHHHWSHVIYTISLYCCKQAFFVFLVYNTSMIVLAAFLFDMRDRSESCNRRQMNLVQCNPELPKSKREIGFLNRERCIVAWCSFSSFAIVTFDTNDDPPNTGSLSPTTALDTVNLEG